ncbi:MAG: hypothetical protein AAFY71_05120 [Bacteroidota bacterium]
MKTFIQTISILFCGLFLSHPGIAQNKVFHLEPFDPAVLALGYAEDSLIKIDEIAFMREEAQRLQEEEEKRQAQLAVARTQQKSTLRSDDDDLSELGGSSMSRDEKLAGFSKDIQKKVPSNAIFLEEEDGEGMMALPVDNTQSIVVMEDRIANLMTVRFEKLRISTLSIRVYKFGGSLVYTKKLYEKPIGYQFDINYVKWPKGVYRFQLKIDDGAWHETVIVKYK